MAPRLETYEDTNGQHRWRITATNGRILATSSEAYHNKADMLHALNLTRQALTPNASET